MFCSRENRALLGGCSSSTPWMRSRALRMSRSFWPSLPLAMRRSRVPIRRVATFHSNPSCSLKNSRNAGSCDSCARSLRAAAAFSPPPLLLPLSLSGVLGGFGFERPIWASKPSTWRRPLRTLGPSYDDRLSKARESRASIVGLFFVLNSAVNKQVENARAGGGQKKGVRTVRRYGNTAR